eukprot:6107884-Pleurochrysis_carterae.AAC.1
MRARRFHPCPHVGREAGAVCDPAPVDLRLRDDLLARRRGPRQSPRAAVLSVDRGEQRLRDGH